MYMYITLDIFTGKLNAVFALPETHEHLTHARRHNDRLIDVRAVQPSRRDLVRCGCPRTCLAE